MNVLLRNAWESGCELEMIYMSEKGELSQRRIKVIDISAGSIRAFCILRKRLRIFKLENILSIGPVKKRFKQGA